MALYAVSMLSKAEKEELEAEMEDEEEEQEEEQEEEVPPALAPALRHVPPPVKKHTMRRCGSCQTERLADIKACNVCGSTFGVVFTSEL